MIHSINTSPAARRQHPRISDPDSARIECSTPNRQDSGNGVVGDINFNRVFFQDKAPRPLKVIDAELAGVEQRILELLREVTQ